MPRIPLEKCDAVLPSPRSDAACFGCRQCTRLTPTGHRGLDALCPKHSLCQISFEEDYGQIRKLRLPNRGPLVFV